jgi:hypothetical protein
LSRAIWHEKQLLIVLICSVLIFIGYNVLTAESTEKEDKKVCEDYNGEWKSIGGGDRGCVIDNEQDQQRYGMRPGFSLDSTGGDAEYGIEDIVTYDNEGNKVYPKTDSSKQQQEEIAAKEDDELSERDVAVLCGASEDYERNQEQCDKLYEMLEEGKIEDDPDFEYD